MPITIDTGRVRIIGEKLQRISNAEMLAAVKPTLSRLLLVAFREVRQQLSGPVLRVRSGNLRGSTDIDPVHQEGAAIVGGVNVTGTGATYGPFLIHGGTIRAKKGKYLAIPVGPAVTGAGVPRFTSPRDVPGLHFLPSKFGGGVLAKTVGKGKNAHQVPHFVLKSSVTIGPHDYVSAPAARLRAAAAAQIPGAVVHSLFQK